MLCLLGVLSWMEPLVSSPLRHVMVPRCVVLSRQSVPSCVEPFTQRQPPGREGRQWSSTLSSGQTYTVGLGSAVVTSSGRSRECSSQTFAHTPPGIRRQRYDFIEHVWNTAFGHVWHMETVIRLLNTDRGHSKNAVIVTAQSPAQSETHHYNKGSESLTAQDQNYRHNTTQSERFCYNTRSESLLGTTRC